MNRPATLQVFVYGTLKRGGANFASYCHGALDVRPARVWGRLYALSAGYPMLAVPPESVLATGTADPAHDLARLHALGASLSPEPPQFRAQAGHRAQIDAPQPANRRRTASPANCHAAQPAGDTRSHAGEWHWVSGELLSFGDCQPRLAALDELEDFRPGAAGYYDRVLVRVALTKAAEPTAVAAWTYVAPLGRVPHDARWLADGCWQEEVPSDVAYPKDRR